jgi:hypothetical protein
MGYSSPAPLLFGVVVALFQGDNAALVLLVSAP